uniref:glycosyltransferase n=1 Tax=Paratractidigestivibacter sp. TaxID=2847316 RepID=UPI002ACB0F92
PGTGDVEQGLSSENETIGTQTASLSAVSLVVPTLNAGSEIGSLLQKLQNQTRQLSEILVVDSSSDDDTAEKVKSVAASSAVPITFKVIDRKDFNHGGTRHEAFLQTSGDFVLFMTQDAVPANVRYVENLLAPFANDRVAVSSGRQLPKADARRFEQLVRSFNYPENSFVRGEEDLATYGIKTFFTSDVCAAYRRSAYDQVGGFQRPCNMSEDMQIAARLVAAGYQVAYAADAEVYHSHNLTPRQQYARNYAVGQFLESNADVLMGVSEIGEGGHLVKKVSGQLLREGRVGEFFAFGIDCMARLAGNRAGRANARKVGA